MNPGPGGLRISKDDYDYYYFCVGDVTTCSQESVTILRCCVDDTRLKLRVVQGSLVFLLSKIVLHSFKLGFVGLKKGAID